MKISSDPQFTPEQEVLLWAIRVDHTNDQRIAEILTSDIKWDYIQEAAIHHGIVPLLYKRLKGEMADLIPLDELSTIRSLFMENAIENIRMTQHLLKVLDLLADSGVEAMSFKGPSLAVQAYGDLSMRSFGDLDLLIHANDCSRVIQILTAQGYIPDNPVIQTMLDKLLFFLYRKDLRFTFNNDLLEVHWKIIERLFAVPLDMDQIWDRSVPIFINGQKIKTLSPEDMVIILCFHGFKHEWRGLKWLADLITMISNHPDLNWHDVFVLAGNMGLKRIVLIGLFLAHKVGGIRCGFEFENLFTSDTTMQKLARKIQHDLFQFQTSEWSFHDPFFYLNSRERFKDQFMFLFYYFPRWILWQIAKRRTGPEKGEDDIFALFLPLEKNL